MKVEPRRLDLAEVHQSVPQGDHGRLGPIRYLQLREHGADIVAYRPLGQVEPRGNVGVGEAARKQPHHLPLPLAEGVSDGGVGDRGAPGSRWSLGKVRRGGGAPWS